MPTCGRSQRTLPTTAVHPEYELDWLRETGLRRPPCCAPLIEPAHGQLSIARQGELVGLAWSSG